MRIYIHTDIPLLMFAHSKSITNREDMNNINSGNNIRTAGTQDDTIPNYKTTAKTWLCQFEA